jgi:ornithine carbamoyltransferase
MIHMKGKSLISMIEYSQEEVRQILRTAEMLKMKQKVGETHELLAGKTLAMIFQKPSLRTRVSFETGMTQLGGHAIYLGPDDIKLGKRESVADIARNLDHMTDGIMARVFEHRHIVELAKYSRVPVINGLCDTYHPCQALADFLTIWEKRNTFDVKLTFVGDGNNVCHSLMIAAAKLGTRMSVGCPKGYEPKKEIIDYAKEQGLDINITSDPMKAVSGADIVYTDVWTSMGQEEEMQKRLRDFSGFQVNMELLRKAKPDVIFMHCLPAHRGEEVTDEVMESRHSVVFDQAENRMHAQKGLMANIM